MEDAHLARPNEPACLGTRCPEIDLALYVERQESSSGIVSSNLRRVSGTNHGRRLLLHLLDDAETFEDLERARIQAVGLTCVSRSTLSVHRRHEEVEEGLETSVSAAGPCAEMPQLTVLELRTPLVEDADS